MLSVERLSLNGRNLSREVMGLEREEALLIEKEYVVKEKYFCLVAKLKLSSIGSAEMESNHAAIHLQTNERTS